MGEDEAGQEPRGETGMSGLFDQTGATFSPCRKYRYRLWRTWAESGPVVNFVMLNPSTADETVNDPTVERCERRSREWNYSGLVVTNIFAFRATDPREMRAAVDPVGPENDEQILEAAHDAHLVICAWGTHGAHLGRGEQVRKRLASFRPLHALALTRDGQPRHPLYLPYTAKPTIWIPGGTA